MQKIYRTVHHVLGWSGLPDFEVRGSKINRAYIDKIAQGAKPANLAVQYATKYALALNKGTATDAKLAKGLRGEVVGCGSTSRARDAHLNNLFQAPDTAAVRRYRLKPTRRGERNKVFQSTSSI